MLFAIGALGFADWLPPDIAPSDSAASVAQLLQDTADGKRIGLTLMVASMCLLAPWGTSIVVQTRRTEGRFPALAYAQLATIGTSTALASAGVVCWAAAAYRPSSASPEIARFAVDLGWHFFYFAWPPFTIWTTLMGLAILWVPRKDAVFPRWAGYLSLWTGFLFVPAALITFFKHGPFGYNGIVAMWVPIVVFFVWIVAMSVLAIQNIRRGEYHDPGLSVDDPDFDVHRSELDEMDFPEAVDAREPVAGVTAATSKPAPATDRI